MARGLERAPVRLTPLTDHISPLFSLRVSRRTGLCTGGCEGSKCADLPIPSQREISAGQCVAIGCLPCKCIKLLTVTYHDSSLPPSLPASSPDPRKASGKKRVRGEEDKKTGAPAERERGTETSSNRPSFDGKSETRRHAFEPLPAPPISEWADRPEEDTQRERED